MDLDRQLQKQLEEIKLNKGATVNVGISPSRAPYLMPLVIELYRKRAKEARVVVKERTTGELVRMLHEGELDLVISLLDEESDAFERVELFDEEILLAVPASRAEDHDAETILKSETLIRIGKGLQLSRMMDEITDAVGAGEPELECQSIESALALVKRGLGVTIVPSYVKQYGSAEENRSLCFLPLPVRVSALKQRRICLFYRKEQFLTAAEKDFIECVREITGPADGSFDHI